MLRVHQFKMLEPHRRHEPQGASFVPGKLRDEHDLHANARSFAVGHAVGDRLRGRYQYFAFDQRASTMGQVIPTCVVM